MNQQPVANVTLFDLLARNWHRPAPIRQICFNDDDDTACRRVRGRLGCNRENGGQRAAGSAHRDRQGQATIRPRQGKAAPLIMTRVKGAGSVSAAL